MSIIKFKLCVEWQHTDNPQERTLDAIDAFKKAVESASEKTPAFGGELRNAKGVRVGSYLMELGLRS